MVEGGGSFEAFSNSFVKKKSKFIYSKKVIEIAQKPPTPPPMENI